MLKEIRQKISLSPELEKKIKWASNYSTTEINIENGTLIELNNYFLFTNVGP